MLKGDISKDRALVGRSSYPPPHDEKLKGRKTWPLTSQWKLTQFGVNRVELPPGAWSTQRHWHRSNDELVIIVSGELTLVTDEVEEVLRAGDCVGLKAGVKAASRRSTTTLAGAMLSTFRHFPTSGWKRGPGWRSSSDRCGTGNDFASLLFPDPQWAEGDDLSRGNRSAV
jgi:mannose-6-phosphate isomerase-like protein (cupin superfamily)